MMFEFGSNWGPFSGNHPDLDLADVVPNYPDPVEKNTIGK